MPTLGTKGHGASGGAGATIPEVAVGRGGSTFRTEEDDA